MSLRGPHTIVYQAQTQRMVAGVAQNKAPTGSPRNIAAFVQGMTPGAALEAFGVELRSPFKVYIDDSDAVSVPGQFTFDGGTYELVAGPVKRTGMSPELSYTMFLAEKVAR